MNQTLFFQELRNAGVPMLSRFLDVPPQSVVVMIQHNLLEEKMDETYSQMPEDELIKFQNELTFNRSGATSEKAPVWSEIRYDYHEETDGFIVAHVDAFKTDDDNEDGEVIAKVVGARVDGKPQIYVSHQDVRAMIDPNAIEAIKDATKEVQDALAELPGELRRLRIQFSEITIIQIIHFDGTADGTIVASVRWSSSNIDGTIYAAQPLIDYTDGLVLDLKDRVEAMVAETIKEIA